MSAAAHVLHSCDATKRDFTVRPLLEFTVIDYSEVGHEADDDGATRTV